LLLHFSFADVHLYSKIAVAEWIAGEKSLSAFDRCVFDDLGAEFGQSLF